MLVKDFKDLKVSLIPSLSQEEFNSATKEIFKKFDYPIPVIGEENWESFDYLISKGVYAGSLIKRLTKWLKKDKGISPESAFVGQIGNIIGKISNKDAETYFVTMSNYFDWTPGTFNYNQSGGSSESYSCFWQSRNCAREALREIYDARSIIVKNSSMDNLARCWIISGMEDDFDNYDYSRTNHDIIFNAYGGLELYKIARILTYCGYSSYNKVSFYTTDDVRMYINSDSGFAMSINGEECRESLRIDPNYEYYSCIKCGDNTSIYHDFICNDCKESQKTCCGCGYDYYRNEGTYVYDDFYCDDCYHELFSICSRCGSTIRKEDVHDLDGFSFCKYCYEREKTSCCSCGVVVSKSESRQLFNQHNNVVGFLCSDCVDNYNSCTICSSTHVDEIDKVSILDYRHSMFGINLILDTKSLCNNCKARLVKVSDGVYISRIDLERISSYIESEHKICAFIKNGEVSSELGFIPYDQVLTDFFLSPSIKIKALFDKISEQIKKEV